MAIDDAAPGSGSGFHRLLSKIIDVRPSEVPALAWSWLYIFSLLSSYYIMRPIRDQMGVAGGVNNLQWLFTGTLIGMLVLNLPFAYLVKTYPREKFIAISYRFFSANILLFALALYVATPEQTIWVGRIFFIWTSIFNLFVVSIFWQMIVDIFTSEQGKRLFGFIAAGATLGAISGSLFTVSTVEQAAPGLLMVGAALMLEVAVFCVHRLSGLSGALSSRPQIRAAAAADRRNLAGRHARCARLRLSAECQPVSPALRRDLDVPVFPASRHRQPRFSKPRGADPVLCRRRPRRERPHLGGAAFS